jgi:cytochrome c oxidase subunit I+III
MADRVEAAVLDVSKLPTVVFGIRSITWWGIMGMMAIEGMVFLLMIASYFYLHSRGLEWPPHSNPPALFWGTLNLTIFVLSAIPNEWYRRRARKGDLRSVRIGLVALALVGITNVVVRYFELLHLNTDWSIDAYGSAVWTLMGFHILHLLTDLVDTIVLAVLFFTPMVEGKRFMDASENADYW